VEKKRVKILGSTSEKARGMTLPKDALRRINLGQSFAEYDKIVLSNPNVFVKTPALQAALEPVSSKSFFVGRRGTGKTAITLYLEAMRKTVIQIHPQAFVPSGIDIDFNEFRDTRRQPFTALLYCFRRAMQGEVLSEWVRRHLLAIDRLPPGVNRERDYIEREDIDFRIIESFEDAFDTHGNREKVWAR